MTKKEIINRNIGLTFDFLRQVVKDPALLDKVPNGSTLEFVEKDFAKIEKPGKTKSKSGRKYMHVKSELQGISLFDALGGYS
jgi:hypothetical protein